jgi:hypothetical protein
VDVYFLDRTDWGDTCDCVFIPQKIRFSLEATIRTLATKDDLSIAIADVKEDIANVKYELSSKISDSIKWMFVFLIGQVGATLAIVFLFLKK